LSFCRFPEQFPRPPGELFSIKGVARRKKISGKQRLDTPRSARITQLVFTPVGMDSARFLLVICQQLATTAGDLPD
jgi:hypothetical protein